MRELRPKKRRKQLPWSKLVERRRVVKLENPRKTLKLKSHSI